MEWLIISIALASNVDPNLLLAVSYKETRIRHIITQNDGGSPSYGPLQIKRIAARQIASNGNPENLEDSIRIGAGYLKYNIKRCHGIESGVTAFNTGHCHPTTEYTKKVMSYYKQFKKKYFYLNFEGISHATTPLLAN